MPHHKKDSSKKKTSYDRKVYRCFEKRRDNDARLEAPDIFYSLRGAVVTIWVETQWDDGQADGIATEVGTGFFVGPKTIVTAAHVVMYDNESLNRVPPTDPSNPLFARGGTITVRVPNVNNKGSAYFYPARLVGVAASLDVAVLEICQNNLPPGTPCIKCQPVLQWGCSRKTAVGEKTFILADAQNQLAVGLSQGVVTDNVYVDPELNPGVIGPIYWGFEGVITDADAVSGNSGGPLLDSSGRVIGVISGVDSNILGVTGGGQLSLPYVSYRTVAVSQHIAERVVNALVAGPMDDCLGGYIQHIDDPLGNFFRFRYGWLGITSFVSMSPEILRYTPDSEFRKHQGFVVREMDPGSPLYDFFRDPYQDWGVTPIVPPTTGNEIYLITRIECDDVGTAMGQVPMSTVTAWHVPCQIVKIFYRLGSNNFECEACCTIQLGEIPIDIDLPPCQTSTVSQVNGASRALPQLGHGVTPSGRAFFKDIGLDLFNLTQIFGADLLKLLGAHVADLADAPSQASESVHAASSSETNDIEAALEAQTGAAE